MIKIQNQEKKKNKYEKHNERVQTAKKVAGAVAGGGAMLAVGALTIGKKALQNAPAVANVAIQIGKGFLKL